jgi:XTP/dITP diphosphohydrolase/tetrapyrrole methylase family protein/MazG family protein
MFAEEVAKRIEKQSLPADGVVDQAHIEQLAANLTAASAGQLLYGLAAACRRAGIDPEAALRQECDRVMHDVEARVQARP